MAKARKSGGPLVATAEALTALSEAHRIVKAHAPAPTAADAAEPPVRKKRAGRKKPGVRKKKPSA